MMVKINLLPVKAKARQYTVVYQLLIGGVAVAATLAVCVILGVMQRFELRARQKDVADLKKEIAELNRLIGEVKQFEQKKAELERKLGVIKSLEKNKVGPVKFLEELSVTIPKKVWLLSVKETTSLAKHSVSFTGQAISDEIIAEFMTKLDESDYFSNVNLIEAKAAGEQQGVPIHSFSMTCDFKVPEPAKPGDGKQASLTPTN